MSNKVEITIPLTLTITLSDSVFLTEEQKKAISTNVGDLITGGQYCSDDVYESICEALGGYSDHKEMYNEIWESDEFNYDLTVSG